MKLKGAKAVHYDSGPNMTPLVDVVMVILIFLMLAGSFGGAEHFLTSNLPIRKDGVGGEAKPGEVEDLVMDVRIVPLPPPLGFRVMAGDIRVDGNPDQMRALFGQKIESYNTNGTPPDQIQVVLSPSGDVKYEHIAEVYQQVLDASAPNPANASKPLKFEKVAFKMSQ